MKTLLLFLGIQSLCFIAGLIMGLWGMGIVPDDCDDSDIRTSIKRLLVVSVIGLTVTISMGSCHYFCLLPSNIEADKSSNFESKPWFTTLLLALNICVMAFGSTIYKNINVDKCKSSETENYQNSLWLPIGLSAIFTLINLYYVGVSFTEQSAVDRETKLQSLK